MRHSREHPLFQAHSPAWSADGGLVYVVCGWQGCEARRQLRAPEWSQELRRRAGLKTTSAPAPGWGFAAAPTADDRTP
jgi:hypothetical protein